MGRRKPNNFAKKSTFSFKTQEIHWNVLAIVLREYFIMIDKTSFEF